MAYFNMDEYQKRIVEVRELIDRHSLDCALVYYDEFNLANAWYLTGWCPQFESGAVLVPAAGEPMILGGPESEPFAKMDSAIKVTRNLPVFMVPDEEYPNAIISSFEGLFKELSARRPLRKAGIVGAAQMPVSVYRQIEAAFRGVEMVDVTEEYLRLRWVKSPWEIEQIRKAHGLADKAYDAMAKRVKPGVHEYEVAAAGELRRAHSAPTDSDSRPSWAAGSVPMRSSRPRVTRSWRPGRPSWSGFRPVGAGTREWSGTHSPSGKSSTSTSPRLSNT